MDVRLLKISHELVEMFGEPKVLPERFQVVFDNFKKYLDGRGPIRAEIRELIVADFYGNIERIANMTPFEMDRSDLLLTLILSSGKLRLIEYLQNSARPRR